MTTQPQQPDTGNPPTLAAHIQTDEELRTLSTIWDSAGYWRERYRTSCYLYDVEKEALVHDHQLAERDLGKLRTFVEEFVASRPNDDRVEGFCYWSDKWDVFAVEAVKLLASLQEAEK